MASDAESIVCKDGEGFGWSVGYEVRDAGTKVIVCRHTSIGTIVANHRFSAGGARKLAADLIRFADAADVAYIAAPCACEAQLGEAV